MDTVDRVHAAVRSHWEDCGGAYGIDAQQVAERVSRDHGSAPAPRQIRNHLATLACAGRVVRDTRCRRWWRPVEDAPGQSARQRADQALWAALQSVADSLDAIQKRDRENLRLRLREAELVREVGAVFGGRE